MQQIVRREEIAYQHRQTDGQAERHKERTADKNTKEEKPQSFSLTAISEDCMEGEEKTIKYKKRSWHFDHFSTNPVKKS